MTELTPAPPPPPAPPATRETIDFARPFQFVFDDPDWVKKIVIGGLFYLASFLLVGLFFVFGYLVKLARNVISGSSRPLPEWDDLGGYFVDGVKVFLITLIYVLPLLVIWIVTIGGVAVAESFDTEALQAALAGLFTCGMGIFVLVILLYSAFLPAAMLMFVSSGSVAEAFNFRRMGRFVVSNPGNYVLAYLIHLVANFLSQFGIILLCVGVVFTAFWSVVVATYAFADAYRLARVR